MALPLLVAGLAGLGRIGVGIAARQAAKKTAEIGLRSATMARGVQPMTKGAAAMGTAGAASAGLSAMDGVRAGANGDVAGAAVGGLGMLPGASMARNAGRAGVSALSAVGAPAYAAADAVNRTGMVGMAPSEATTPPVVQQPVTPQQPQNTQDGQPTTTAADIAAEAEARRQAAAATRLDAERTSNINGFGARAGQNYQEITDDLRNMAKQGVREWQPRDSGMTEWEADNRRREIRMAYSNHPIPGKGEGKVLEFDQDLQKRREAIENARVAGFNANTGAFDKALSALGQANGQSVDMADKMFGQTAARRGQDIAAQKNLWDAQASDKTATAQLFTALGGLGGGKGGKGDSPYKGEKERLDYLKALAETQYPDNPQGQKKLIDSVLLNSENGKAWDTLMQDGMPNVANELLTSMTDQTTYTPEQLGGATRSRFNMLDQLKGQWDDLGTPADNTTWFEPRYTIPGRSDSVNERTLANLKNQSVTDLVKQAVLNPTQQVNGMPFTYAEFSGDEAAFQREVMAYFQAAHQVARNGSLSFSVERDANGQALNPFR